MSKIVDIKFVAGRRAEVIEEENAKNELIMKLAQSRYTAYCIRHRPALSVPIQEWVRRSGDGQEDEFCKLFPDSPSERIKVEMEKAGIHVPMPSKEVSLEKKILDHLKDGWVLKGDIIPNSGSSWVQTLVKYETVEEPVDLLGVGIGSTPIVLHVKESDSASVSSKKSSKSHRKATTNSVN